jgi:hypothetical protein
MSALEKIVKFISENLQNASEKNPNDVELKYLAEDENKPYWFIYFDDHHESLVLDFEELVMLKEKVEKEGFKIEFVSKGIYLDRKD